MRSFASPRHRTPRFLLFLKLRWPANDVHTLQWRWAAAPAGALTTTGGDANRPVAWNDDPWTPHPNGISNERPEVLRVLIPVEDEQKSLGPRPFPVGKNLCNIRIKVFL